MNHDYAQVVLVVQSTDLICLEASFVASVRVSTQISVRAMCVPGVSILTCVDAGSSLKSTNEIGAQNNGIEFLSRLHTPLLPYSVLIAS